MRRRELLFTGLAASALRAATSYSHELPDMLLAELTRELNALAAKWDAVKAQVRSPEEVEKHLAYVRAATLEMLGPLPPRTPLEPKVIRIHRRSDYRIENVAFQSRPDFWVTGNLWIPEPLAQRAPGIISPCGHYPLARMEPEYQAAYLNLVKSGFVVLAFDPIGQGERRQYWNPRTRETEVGGATTEHSMAGQLLLLLGENLTLYRVWDGMRAIDYLESRPEVDRERIGCAGHSGGGTLTKFIGAVDPRVRCAVINEGGTANRWPIDLRPESRIGPSDVEQNLFPAALHGIDNPDLHAAFAPRPLLAMIEGYSPRFNRAADYIRLRYRQLGVEERFATEEATDPHAWTPKLRIGATNWFRRWFLNAAPLESEPPLVIERAQALFCTPEGSVRVAGWGDTIHTIIQRKASDAARTQHLPSADEIRSVLRLPQGGQPFAARNLVTTARNGYSVEKIEFLSEPRIYLPAWLFHPNARTATAGLLYVHESGKQADGMEFGLLEELAQRGIMSMAIDVRGVGETRPRHAPPGERPGDFTHLFSVETAMAYMAWYMDRDLFGMRVHDVLRAAAYLRERFKDGRVRLAGRGAGALWALYAAALDPAIGSVLCERPLASYHELLASDRYLHTAAIFLRGVYPRFDLPHVAATLAGRQLIIAAPVDAMRRPLPAPRAEEAYALTRTRFRSGTFAVTGDSDRLALYTSFFENG